MYTALFLAAQKGLLEIAQVLLSWGADPNTVGEVGMAFSVAENNYSMRLEN